MKTCRRCCKEKESGDFYAAARMKDGLHSWCKDCLNARAMERYREIGEAEKHLRRERCREWRKKNPDKRRANKQAWHGANRAGQLAAMWRARLRRKYDMAEADYEAMAERQDGRCAICADRPEGRLVVDHDHDSGAVRGLLCDPCNKGLGFFRDSPSRLATAADYLQMARRRTA